MSGGSYNYLCHYTDDVSELLRKQDQVRAMANRLRGLGYANDAAIETERVLAMLERMETQITVRAESLRELWKAVEWWDSCDWSEEDLKTELSIWRGDKAVRHHETCIEVTRLAAQPAYICGKDCPVN